MKCLPIMLRNSVCNMYMRIPPAMFTQVRFVKEPPRYHGDLKYPNFDDYRKSAFKNPKRTTWGSGDEKPGYTYLIAMLGFTAGAFSLKQHGSHYIYYMAAAADVRAMATIEVDLSKIVEGKTLSVKWRGKPLFIKHRTASEQGVEQNTPMSSLKDPETPEQRCQKPEWLIVIGICTHLGCVPVPDSGDYVGGFYCPCHGSHYDNLGRARKGPAPLNLEIPPHKYTTDNIILVG